MDKCVLCGHEGMTRRSNGTFDTIRAGVLQGLAVYDCPACGEEYTEVPMRQSLDKAPRKAVAARKSSRSHGCESE